MKKIIINIYIFISIIFIIGVLVYSFLILNGNRNSNIDIADDNFDEYINLEKINDQAETQNTDINNALYTIKISAGRPVLEKPVTIDSSKYKFEGESFSFKAVPFISKTFAYEFNDSENRLIQYYSLYYVITKADIFDLLKNLIIPVIIFFALTLIILPVSYIKPGSLSVDKDINSPDFDIEPVYDEHSQDNDIQAIKASPVDTGSAGKASETVKSVGSGISDETLLENRLNSELKRAASFDQDIVLALLSCKSIRTREKHNQAAELLKDNFIFHDLIFDYEGFSFAVILPNMDLDHGVRKIESIQSQLVEKGHISQWCSSSGLSSRNGRLLNGKRIIQEAKAALKKSREEQKNSIIGFRSDPQKYRKYLANS